MAPERYQQVKAIYQAALERAVEERVPYVAAACADDVALRDEVESLLATELETKGFLDTDEFQTRRPALPELTELLQSATCENWVGLGLNRSSISKLSRRSRWLSAS